MQIQPRRYRKGLLLAACSLTLAGFFFVLPMYAEAKTAQTLSAEFSLAGSNGYWISVDGGHHKVAISVSEGRLRPSRTVETVYTFPGTVSRDAIEANLGGFGEISLRFVPSGKVTIKRRSKLPKGCKAPRSIVRRQGAFVGIIRFEGERGYTTVDATQVNGSIGTPEGIVCGSFNNGSGGKRCAHRAASRPLPYLDAATPHNGLSFGAAVLGDHRQHVSFVARSFEKSGTISIVRWVSVVASRSDFKFNHRLTTASVTPPPPFSGTATFRRQYKASPSWTGSLAVSFLGTLGVSLTGANFTSVNLTRF